MKLYWVSAIVQGNSKPKLIAMNTGELSQAKAERIISAMRQSYNVLSAWIDTFDENNNKETVFHECYIDAFGIVRSV